MMKKIMLILMILVAVASAAAVSASDNATDIASDGVSVTDESQIEEVSEDEDTAEVSEDDSQDEEVLASSDSDEVLCENALSEVTESKITASNVRGYTSFSSTVPAVLTSNGTALASKPVKIILNGITYNKVTDANGKVSVSARLAKGTYTAQLSMQGTAQQATHLQLQP